MAKKKVAKKAASTGKAKTSTKKNVLVSKKKKAKREDNFRTFPSTPTIANGEPLWFFLGSLSFDLSNYELETVTPSTESDYQVILPSVIHWDYRQFINIARLTSDEGCIVKKNPSKAKGKKRVLAGTGKLTITIKTKGSTSVKDKIDITIDVNLIE